MHLIISSKQAWLPLSSLSSFTTPSPFVQTTMCRHLSLARCCSISASPTPPPIFEPQPDGERGSPTGAAQPLPVYSSTRLDSAGAWAGDASTSVLPGPLSYLAPLARSLKHLDLSDWRHAHPAWLQDLSPLSGLTTLCVSRSVIECSLVWSPLPGLTTLCVSSSVLLLDDWWRFYTLLLLLWHGIHWTAVDSESAFFFARPRQI